ncbi:MAG: OsmC family protein [Planctomycetes bacterium]|nr:OsmC family protein [Planctomycetota bacterium]
MAQVRPNSYQYEVELLWVGGKVGLLKSGDAPELSVAPPIEFGGPAGKWAPEELFISSIQSCMMGTFLYFTEKLKVNIQSYASTAKGIMNMTPAGLRFTQIDVYINAKTDNEQSHEKLISINMKEKIEKYCPVSAAVSCPINLTINITPNQ